MDAPTLRAAVRHLVAYAALIEEHAQAVAWIHKCAPAEADTIRHDAKTRAAKVSSIARELKAELPKGRP